MVTAMAPDVGWVGCQKRTNFPSERGDRESIAQRRTLAPEAVVDIFAVDLAER